MTAKPANGLLICLAAVWAAYLDRGIVKRAFGDDASLSKKPGLSSMALSSPGVYSHRCVSDGDWNFRGGDEIEVTAAFAVSRQAGMRQLHHRTTWCNQ
jgi:hypothetical protein